MSWDSVNSCTFMSRAEICWIPVFFSVMKHFLKNLVQFGCSQARDHLKLDKELDLHC